MSFQSPLRKPSASSTQQQVRSTPRKGSLEGSSVSVYLRIRPPARVGDDVDHETGLPTYAAVVNSSVAAAAAAAAAADGTEVKPTPPTIARATPPGSSAHSRTIGRQVKDFTFSEVFPQRTPQAHVYAATTQPLVEDLLLGRNGLLFAYGLTNGGKTFTTLGDDKQPGILPRALQDIFQRLEATATTAGASPPRVIMSFLEVRASRRWYELWCCWCECTRCVLN
jgi:Kinesin motor domain